MPRALLTTTCCNYSPNAFPRNLKRSSRGSSWKSSRHANNLLGVCSSLYSSAKWEKGFMNAHMKNETSLRAIHNEIRASQSRVDESEQTAIRSWTCAPRRSAENTCIYIHIYIHRYIILLCFSNYDYKQDIGLKLFLFGHKV